MTILKDTLLQSPIKQSRTKHALLSVLWLGIAISMAAPMWQVVQGLFAGRPAAPMLFGPHALHSMLFFVAARHFLGAFRYLLDFRPRTLPWSSMVFWALWLRIGLVLVNRILMSIIGAWFAGFLPGLPNAAAWALVAGFPLLSVAFLDVLRYFGSHDPNQPFQATPFSVWADALLVTICIFVYGIVPVVLWIGLEASAASMSLWLRPFDTAR